MKQIIILNGPNLNLVGQREPTIYGNISFDEYIPYLREIYSDLLITYHQSNHEGVLIDLLHQYGFTTDGIILNAGGYTHTSIALADAVKAITTPVIEVHISNLLDREDFRKHSYLKDVCVQSIMGKGIQGYNLALQQFIDGGFGKPTVI